MKERQPEEETYLQDTALTLWQNLGEVVELYLKDFPTREEHNFRFYKGIRVALNFAPYENNKESGIGAVSIAQEGDDDCQFRRDIVVKKTKGKGLVCVVKETDIDPSTNYLPNDKNYPVFERALPQPISYFEQIIRDSENPGAVFRKPSSSELYEALRYVEAINLSLCHMQNCGNLIEK